MPGNSGPRSGGHDPTCDRRDGSGRAQRGVSCIQRGRLPPAHRHFGSATSRTRTNDATRADRRPEDHDEKSPRACPLTTEGSRCHAPPTSSRIDCHASLPTATPPLVSRYARVQLATGQRCEERGGRQVGARVLEGYPTEPPPGKAVIWDEASVGLLQVFLAAGYEVVASPTLRRRVVRLRLGASS
jgi:hypothetical protein